MRLDAHAIPEDALAAAATSLVSRFALETDVRVLQTALQLGAALGASVCISFSFRFRIGSAFSAAGIGRAGGGITGATSGGTAS